MALNIKDPEVDRLATELAAHLRTNKTDAIRRALSDSLASIPAQSRTREDRLLEVLHTEIWPLLSDQTPISKREREEILGYDAAGGV